MILSYTTPTQQLNPAHIRDHGILPPVRCSFAIEFDETTQLNEAITEIADAYDHIYKQACEQAMKAKYRRATP